MIYEGDDTNYLEPLQDVRREKFAQLLFKGGLSKVKAYEAAGYAPTASSATRLAKEQVILRRIRGLTELTAKESRNTVADIVRQLDEDRLLAHKTKSASAAVAASMAKAKLLGLIIDKSEREERREVRVTKIERVIVDPGDDAKVIVATPTETSESDDAHAENSNG